MSAPPFDGHGHRNNERPGVWLEVEIAALMSIEVSISDQLDVAIVHLELFPSVLSNQVKRQYLHAL